MNFNIFKNAVAKQFERMQKHELFRVQVDKDTLWATYLGAFPAGTDLIFRERTEHDCSGCKQFIRAIGDTVAIIDGKLVSIWDISIPEEPTYQLVANALAARVKAAKVNDLFLHYERTAGTDKNFEQLVDRMQTWTHFFVNIGSEYVKKNADIPSALAEPRATHDVLLRSLAEIKVDAIDTVLELIAQNSLYRGNEHKFAVESFRKLKVAFDKLDAEGQALFAWVKAKGEPASVTKIRSTVIGTLLTDLSEGKDMDGSVAAFESKVAPANYKRPTALITKGMIEKAKQTLADLGLTSALERRHATIADITINNILFADREARKTITGDVFDELGATAATKVKALDKIEEVGIDRFLSEILPRAESLEVMLENSHQGNLMSLIAPVDPTSGRLFKWDNNFSWSYAGEFADSIKERVKKAGGNVTGDLCCRLAWDYADDLDFHMLEPGGGHIYFSNRRSKSPCGGMLDVDANGIDGPRDNPVENIFYADRNRMRDGVYTLNVNNYNRRSAGTGFEVELEFDGQVVSMAYAKAMKSGETITVCKVKVKDGKFEIVESLPTSKSVRTIWGVPTNTFNKVKMVMLSPNYWDDQKTNGNKHFFFIMEGCENDTAARGFFNEFLKESLNEHRKVFEVVASKMKVGPSTEQLSGVGFSSTQRNTLVCRVKGSFTRTIKVVF
jgi:hypothetical protein